MRMTSELALERCPHCMIARPRLELCHSTQPISGIQRTAPIRIRAIYQCRSCEELIVAVGVLNANVERYYPHPIQVSEDVPHEPRNLLTQALNTYQEGPHGAIVTASTAVDTMLIQKNFKARGGNLFNGINSARDNNQITEQMSDWAHEVRLDGNDQRHANDDLSNVTPEEAKKTIDFAMALAEYLFVLPAKITRGRS